MTSVARSKGYQEILKAVDMAKWAINDARNEPTGGAFSALTVIANNAEIEATKRMSKGMASVLAEQIERAFQSLLMLGYLVED